MFAFLISIVSARMLSRASYDFYLALTPVSGQIGGFR